MESDMVWIRGLKKFSNMDRYQFLKKFGYGYTFSLLQPCWPIYAKHDKTSWKPLIVFDGRKHYRCLDENYCFFDLLKVI